jgi:hypothetical protein
VTQFLNQLLTQVHSYIYQSDVADYKRLIRYFTHVIPQAFRRARVFIFIAFLMFFIPAAIGFLIAHNITLPTVRALADETRRPIAMGVTPPASNTLNSVPNPLRLLTGCDMEASSSFLAFPCP